MKKIITAVLFAVLIGFWVTGGTPVQAASVNLLVNPGFEGAAAEPDGLPTSWAEGVREGTPTAVLDSFIYREGGQSLRMTGTSVLDRLSAYTSYEVASSWSGSVMTYSIYQKTESLASAEYGTAVRIFFLDDTDRSASEPLYVPGAQGTSDWTRMEASFIVPERTTRIVFEQLLWAASGTVWWDLASLTSGMLVENSGFEVDVAPANGAPDAWDSRNYVQPYAGRLLDNSVSYQGERSVRLTGSEATSRGSYAQTLDVSDEVGRTVTLSAMHKTDGIVSSSYGTALRVTFLDENNQSVLPAKYIAGNKGTNDWAALTDTFVIPPQTNHLLIEVFLWAATGTVWWDDVRLVRHPDYATESIRTGEPPNAGFEVESFGVDRLPEYYMRVVTEGTPLVLLTDGEAWEGERSVRITGTTATDEAGLVYVKDNAAAMVGNSYVYAVYQKTEQIVSADYGTAIRIRFLNAADAELKPPLYAAGAKGTTGWSRLEAAFSVPPGTERIVFEHLLWKATGDVWWDDASLTQPEFLHNAGFDTDDIAPFGVPDQWSTRNYGQPNPTVAMDEAVKRSGPYAARLTGSAPTSRGALSQSINVSAYNGQELRLDVWHKTEQISSGDLGTRVRVLFLDAANQAVIPALYINGSKGTTDWAQLSETFVVPDRTAQLQIEFFIWNASGTVWWDDARLTPISTGWLSDPSFEHDPGDGGISYAWSVGTDGSADVTRDTGFAYHGLASVKMTGLTIDDTARLSQSVMLEPRPTEQLFTLSLRYRASALVSTGWGAAVRLEYRDILGQPIGETQTLPLDPGATDWSYAEWLGSAPAGTAEIQLQLLLDQASGTVWWDFVDMRPYAFVVNGDFELDDNDDGQADGWLYSVTSGSPQFELDDVNAYSGEHSLRMSGLSRSDAGFARQVINLPASGAGVPIQGYRISVHHKVENVKSNVQGTLLRISFHDAANLTVGPVYLVRGAKYTQDWTRLEQVVSTPYGAVKMYVQASLQYAEGTVWWDRLEISPLPLLINPELERDDDRDGEPDGWALAATGPGSHGEIDDLRYNEGNNRYALRSYRLENASSTDQASLSQTFPLLPELANGFRAVVQARPDGVMANGSTQVDGARMKLAFLDEADTVIGVPVYTMAPSGSADWLELSRSIVPPFGTVRVQLALELWNASGAVNWDQLAVLPADVPPTEPVLFTGTGSLYLEGRPLLDWRNSHNAFSYTIQYSRDASFAIGVTTVSDLTTSEHMPQAQLEDGVWYARGTVTDVFQTTSGYGPVHTFQIQRLEAFPDTFTPNGDAANDETMLNYTLQDPSIVSLVIRDSAQTVVRTVYDEAMQMPGYFTWSWDGRDGQGAPVADGEYVAELTVETGGRTYASVKTIIVYAADTAGYRGLENDKDWSQFVDDLIDSSAKLMFDFFDPASGRYTYDPLSNTLWPTNTAGYSYVMAYSYLTPGMTYYQDPQALSRAIGAWEAVVNYEVGSTGSWARERNLDANQDLFSTAVLADTYLMLEDHLDEAKQLKFEQYLQRATQYQLDTYKQDANYYGKYPNIDQVYTYAMAAVGTILNRNGVSNTLLQEAAATLLMIEDEIFENGGLSYLDGTSPSAGYQDLIGYWSRYYDVTADPNVLPLVQRTLPYYPLLFEVDGVAEYGSAPELKTQWKSIHFPMGADLVASLTGDGQNKMVANIFKERLMRNYPLGMNAMVQVFHATLSRNANTSVIVPLKLSEPGVVRDPDIEGLRGRWGTFTAAITAGKVQPSRVSAMVNTSGNPFAVSDGALGWAYFESKEGALGGERPKDWAYILPAKNTDRMDTASQPGIVVDQVHIDHKIGAQHLKFIPVPYYSWQMHEDNSAEWDWEARETWVLFRDRLIGMNSMRVKESNTTPNAGESHFARSRLVFGPLRNGQLSTEIEGGELYGSYNRLGFWLNLQSTDHWRFNTELFDVEQPGSRSTSPSFRSAQQVAVEKKADGNGTVAWGPYAAVDPADTMSYHAVFFPLKVGEATRDWRHSGDNNIEFRVPQPDVHAALIDAADGSGEIYAVIVNHRKSAVNGNLSVPLANGEYVLERFLDSSGTAAETIALTVSAGEYSLAYSLAADELVIFRLTTAS